MDVLTEALAAMRTGSPVSARTAGRAPWGLQLAPVPGASFHVVLRGTCWLLDDSEGGGGTRLALGPGDVVFLRDGRGHVLADHPGTPAVGPEGYEKTQDGPIARITLGGDGVAADLLCGAYHLDTGRSPHPLFTQLPALIHLPARPGAHPELTAAVQLLGGELENPRAGSHGIVPLLIDSLLLYILRAWLEDQPVSSAGGWAGALRDPATAAALTAIHAEPAAQWTVASLAAEAGLSRAGFARRFAELVGEPPLAYLTRWRMTTAAKLLREGDIPLSTVAEQTGYGSEYALGKAFKREYGQAPGSYRRQARLAA
ncbi:AraC family transcriptional regulator [Kitasatospora viridis]|uniref:AraC family transcriptional regulator n=1 Tax=Kitasatospora viridis TaxID=281105 RepID=A0A561T6V7_9ACTN|nr:AraC family transcriptional regulator [Kitasatospora viridis]TWF82830.1 AraC family transcriptional regulator [Kitasatospora viridis]